MLRCGFQTCFASCHIFSRDGRGDKGTRTKLVVLDVFIHRAAVMTRRGLGGLKCRNVFHGPKSGSLCGQFLKGGGGGPLLGLPTVAPRCVLAVMAEGATGPTRVSFIRALIPSQGCTVVTKAPPTGLPSYSITRQVGFQRMSEGDTDLQSTAPDLNVVDCSGGRNGGKWKLMMTR